MFEHRVLSEKDVPEVVYELLDMQTKSAILGRLLKLPKSRVDSIHQQNSDPQERLFSVIDEFVKQIEPKPTWKIILEALKNPLIGQTRLAQELERKYFCKEPSFHFLFPS